MKKILLIMILALSTTFVFGQHSKNDVAEGIAYLLVEETDGYIYNHFTNTDGLKIFLIGFPSYYDFDLVRMALRKIVNEFSDVDVVLPWRKHNTIPELMFTLIGVNTEYKIIVSYNTKTKIVMVTPSAG